MILDVAVCQTTRNNTITLLLSGMRTILLWRLLGRLDTLAQLGLAGSGILYVWLLTVVMRNARLLWASADTAMSSDRSVGGWTAPVLHDVTTIVDPLRRDVRDLVRLDGSRGRTRGEFL